MFVVLLLYHAVGVIQNNADSPSNFLFFQNIFSIYLYLLKEYLLKSVFFSLVFFRHYCQKLIYTGLCDLVRLSM